MMYITWTKTKQSFLVSRCSYALVSSELLFFWLFYCSVETPYRICLLLLGKICAKRTESLNVIYTRAIMLHYAFLITVALIYIYLMSGSESSINSIIIITH